MSKLLALILTALQVWMPAFFLYMAASSPLPVYAQDRFLDAARQGQAVGRGLVPDASSLGGQDAAGNVILHWQGKTSTIDPSTLFPDHQNVNNPNAAEVFGNHAGVVNLSQSEVQTMESSQSMTGQAYRTIMGSSNRARVNLSNQPWWNQTDTAIDQVMNGEFGNCEIITTTTPVTSQAHVPAYRTCERVLYPGGTCRCYHDYSIDFLQQFGASASCWTDDDCVIRFNLQTNEILGCSGSHQAYGCQVLSPTVDINEVCLEVKEGIVRTISATDNTYNYGVYQVPSCDNDLEAVLYVHNVAGSHNLEHLTVSAAVNTYHIIDRGWTCDPGCEVLLDNVAGDSIIRPTDYACTQGPCVTATQIAGAWVNETDLYSTNPFASVGISNLAHEVTITLEDWNQGQMSCWTDPQGEVHCPQNTGERQDTCEELENDPNCVFIRQECIEGAEDPNSGTCYAWTVVYDCGYNVELENYQTEMGYMCDGVIRCMGEECVDGQFDLNNTGFARAAAMLQVAQYATSDMDCTDPHAGCRIWSGEVFECKKALGGWVDCCVEPEGISLVSYIKLLYETKSLTSAQWQLDNLLPDPLATNPFSGTWADLSTYTDPITDPITNWIEDLFSSAWDALTGTVESAATQEAGLSLSTSITQHLMETAYKLIESVSPDLANAVFTLSPYTPIGGGPTVMHYTLSPGMQTLVSVVNFISWMYTIYNVLDILVHIIWACEEEEFVLGAKKQLKVCHYVGSYCATKALGVCIEKRESYCCYNSPLARIMQEQIRAQLRIDWGDADDPNCDGLFIYQLEDVDWDQIDLSEWLALLAVAGEYPTQREFTLDGLTGSGSQWNFGNTDPDSIRPDAATRTLDRLNQDGVDIEQMRIKGGLQLWGQGD